VAEALGVDLRACQQFEARSPLPVRLPVPFADLVGVEVRRLLPGKENK
jgi:hypothetical protein